MAHNAVSSLNSADTVPEHTLCRWQSLFGYSAREAATHIERHRADLNRPRVSDQHWALVREAKEAEGHDRESYEYFMSISPVKGTQKKAVIPANAQYLCLLEGPLKTNEKVRVAAGLSTLPKVHKGLDEDGKALGFVALDAQATIQLLSAFEGQAFQPSITCMLPPAAKKLSQTTLYPFLGVDTTLPQYRPQGSGFVRPMQYQYPVVYFFYGTLGEPDRLVRLLGLKTAPKLEEATVAGGKIKTWVGGDKALVDGSFTSRVRGVAYEVVSKEHEDALRRYETGKYEVVRCNIHTEERGVVRGLTFRFRCSDEAA
ncbi:predicted protein [Uncinocarpus reesii 1704]|uniref:Putative gamma-glutamylcyclotransferase n=1 Tax=Uncinocarpus reesii (strain UAMH 1704) TaxID=336963 RepID=C4JXL3_UNCRE|nr:uncharacterized protein UREG_06386 [Uncinocarpus reesii 1704]EEP81521.1 predicted protein [Uncinocarpus reesii 1704]